MSHNDWESVIGLEVHAQLSTKSKIFSPDGTEFGVQDNSQVHPVSLGLPGTLPVLNQEVLNLATLIGLSLNCQVNLRSVFARKNYFYPDLPKGYQISQFDEPLCERGFLEFFFQGSPIRIDIVRAHLEEDAGKSIHLGDSTLLNFNRAGIPLLEIVSAPKIHSPAVAAEFVRQLRRTLRYINACDGNLEEGSLRCDCNVSVRKKGEPKLGTRVELKNINSFRFIEKAIEYEVQRQIDVLETGGKIVQETRLYDSVKNRTVSMRSKEEAHDYRYFPDPDLLPLQLDSVWLEEQKKKLPELPFSREKRLREDWGLSEVDSANLVEEKDVVEFFEDTVRVCQNPKSASAWIMGELNRELNSHKIEVRESPISSFNLGNLIKLIDTQVISGKMAKEVFNEMWETKQAPDSIVKAKGWVQLSDENALREIIDQILQLHQDQVEQFRQGKEKVLGFFVGQIMKATQGQAHPERVNRILKEQLKK